MSSRSWRLDQIVWRFGAIKCRFVSSKLLLKIVLILSNNIASLFLAKKKILAVMFPFTLGINHVIVIHSIQCENLNIRRPIEYYLESIAQTKSLDYPCIKQTISTSSVCPTYWLLVEIVSDILCQFTLIEHSKQSTQTWCTQITKIACYSNKIKRPVKIHVSHKSLSVCCFNRGWQTQVTERNY